MPMRLFRRNDDPSPTLPTAYHDGTSTTPGGSVTRGAHVKPTFKSDLAATGFEFLGTCVFLILAFGVVQSTYVTNEIHGGPAGSATADNLYRAAGFGFAKLIATWLFFRVTGSLFNPNIALALLITRNIGFRRFALFVVAQLAAGIASAALIQALMPGTVSYETVPFSGVNKTQAVFIEMFATSFLVLAVLMVFGQHRSTTFGSVDGEKHRSTTFAAGRGERHRSTPFAPVGVGLTVFVCMLWTLPLTGGSLNTARSFGPAVIHRFPGSHWIYWVGPTLGALLASAVFMAARRSRHWTLSPANAATNGYTRKGVETDTTNTYGTQGTHVHPGGLDAAGHPHSGVAGTTHETRV